MEVNLFKFETGATGMASKVVAVFAVTGMAATIGIIVYGVWKVLDKINTKPIDTVWKECAGSTKTEGA